MEKFISRIESELTDYNLDQPELKTVLDRLILINAKRVRPRLAYVFIKAFGEDLSDSQVELISAGEILHTASLIHDDIVDNAFVRRGMETLNSKFDTHLAVLAGDFLASFGIKKILSLNNQEIADTFLSAFDKMCRAEIFQYFARGRVPDLAEYFTKTAGKTASLFSAILEGTAILSSSIDKNTAADFGTAFGIAFQIKNDLEAFINTPDRDRKNEIYTAPDIFYLEKNDLNFAIEKTNALIDNEIEKMLKIISDVPEGIYKTQLIQMIKESLCRTKK